MGIFGDASPKELSDINHTFKFWKLAANLRSFPLIDDTFNTSI